MLKLFKTWLTKNETGGQATGAQALEPAREA